MEALAGTLKTAKKHGVVKYDNEMLFQGQHDDVIINLLKSEIPDATADTCALSVPEGGREREREGGTGRTGVRKSEGGVGGGFEWATPRSHSTVLLSGQPAASNSILSRPFFKKKRRVFLLQHGAVLVRNGFANVNGVGVLTARGVADTSRVAPVLSTSTSGPRHVPAGAVAVVPEEEGS